MERERALWVPVPAGSLGQVLKVLICWRSRPAGDGLSLGAAEARPGEEHTHLQAAQVGRRHVAGLTAARPRYRQPPVRAAALQHREGLARGERQRIGLRRAERVQRAVHEAESRREGRGHGGG